MLADRDSPAYLGLHSTHVTGSLRNDHQGLDKQRPQTILPQTPHLAGGMRPRPISRPQTWQIHGRMPFALPSPTSGGLSPNDGLSAFPHHRQLVASGSFS